MRRNDDGDILVTDEELRILRQGLFITLCHLDPTFEKDLHALTGVTRDEFADLMHRVDELRG